MNKESIRLSTLAEIRVLSLQSLLAARNVTAGDAALENISNLNNAESFASIISDDRIRINPELIKRKITAEDATRNSPNSLFRTIGIARTLRIQEDYQTAPVYAIGNPIRPRMVPGNMQITVSCERIQLDKRHLYDFMTSPEYFYSGQVQKRSGILDGIYYTYLFLRNKEGGDYPPQIYALMPKGSTSTIASGEVIIVNNVDLVGFKVHYGTTISDLLTGENTDDITLSYSDPL